MIIPIFDNLTVIILTIASLLRTENPVAVLICAGILMVAVTADSLESPLRYLKYPGALGFAVFGGVFASFAVIFLIDNLKPVLRVLAATAFFLVCRGVMMFAADAGDPSFIAKSILYALLLAGIMTIIIFIRFSIKKMIIRKKEGLERLAKANLSELHERQLNRELKEQNYLAEKNARLVERENISRNIHNTVGHSITAAVMTLDAADMLFEVKPEEARTRMNDANERIRGSLESIRRAVRTLDEEGNPVTLDDLMDDLSAIIDEFVMDLKVNVDKVFKKEDFGGSLIEHEHAEFLTGVLKELLTNGIKHGGATYFSVFLTGDSAHLRLGVNDNGKSDFSEENSRERIENGFGIKKIIKYVNHCGGKATFEANDGFRAVVELPLLAKADSE